MHKSGKPIHNARLSEEDVLQIRKLYADGMKQGQIAKLYKIDQPYCSRIINKKVWSHI